MSYWTYWTGVSGIISVNFCFEGDREVDASIPFQIAREQTKKAMGATLVVVNGEGLESLRRQFGSDRVIDYTMDLEKVVDDDSAKKIGKIDDDFKARDNKVPYGSESSIQYSLTLNDCCGSYHDEPKWYFGEVKMVIPFWGNLRDFGPERKPELTDWFKKVVKNLNPDGSVKCDSDLSYCVFTNGHMMIYDHDGGHTVHHEG